MQRLFPHEASSQKTSGELVVLETQNVFGKHHTFPFNLETGGKSPKLSKLSKLSFPMCVPALSPEIKHLQLSLTLMNGSPDVGMEGVGKLA